ncbi:Lipid A export ATP-binding/permease protein MsbA [Ruegeria meonggei]|uniref:Lipid A export ATP-binding/permease protein MsbA n=1 Tax=Ruegeria meonggei TaxID=1446476 RepID=A0A1X6ZLH6_9RHOB|nr:Lipid A export ATP-binding/permease protein MsbA [Ruegeria meonggei]
MTCLAFCLGGWLDQGTSDDVSLGTAAILLTAFIAPVASLKLAVSFSERQALEARTAPTVNFGEHSKQSDLTRWAQKIVVNEDEEGVRVGMTFISAYSVALTGTAFLILIYFGSLAGLPLALGICGILFLAIWATQGSFAFGRTAETLALTETLQRTRELQSRLSTGHTSSAKLGSRNRSSANAVDVIPLIYAGVAGCVSVLLVDLSAPGANTELFLTASGVIGLGIASLVTGPAIAASTELSKLIVANQNTSAEPKPLTPYVSLRNVSSTYPGQKNPVYKGLNLDIPPDSLIGFCGESGSGKTTLCRTLLGLLDPSEGEILYGNPGLPRKAEQKFPDNYLHGLVDDPPLAQMSIEQIISNYGTLPKQRVLAAATATGFINDIATFPLGLRTNVGFNGSMLSNSQRQLLSLTAAVALRPSILVLDNPVSALPDMERARLILRVKPLVKTLIVTSNSINVLNSADAIFKISNRMIIKA